MARHYLLYWKLRAVEYRFYGEALDTFAHNALKKAEVGDCVWLVTVRGGDLLLVGRIMIGAVHDHAESEAVFELERQPRTRWYATAQDGTAEPLRLVNLTELGITFSLRFQSAADRLRVNRRGRLNVLSLYHLRRLTDDSAVLLRYIWLSTADTPQSTESVDIDEDHFVYAEGRATRQSRVVRQRSAGLVSQAKDRYLSQHGDLHCEVCGMSFAEVYGDVGRGYIELHHPDPIADREGEGFTDVDDMVLLCANCHRMLHRKTPPYTIDELKAVIRRSQQGHTNDVRYDDTTGN